MVESDSIHLPWWTMYMTKSYKLKLSPLLPSCMFYFFSFFILVYVRLDCVVFSYACVLFSFKLIVYIVYVQIFAHLFISLMCICWIYESTWFSVNYTMKKLSFLSSQTYSSYSLALLCKKIMRRKSSSLTHFLQLSKSKYSLKINW